MTALAVALLGLSLANNPAALAAGDGRASGTAAVASGTFGVMPVQPGTSLLQGVMAFTAVLPQPAYLDALNTGSLALTGTSYSVNFVYTGVGIPTLTLAACPNGSWTGGTCSTSAVTIATVNPGTTVVNVTAAGTFPAAVGARLPLKATVGGASLTVGATATVTSSVSTGATRQVRAATTTEK